MNSEDLIVWPCGTCCFGSELHEYSHMSDDYKRIPVDSDTWVKYCNEMDARY